MDTPSNPFERVVNQLNDFAQQIDDFTKTIEKIPEKLETIKGTHPYALTIMDERVGVEEEYFVDEDLHCEIIQLVENYEKDNIMQKHYISEQEFANNTPEQLSILSNPERATLGDIIFGCSYIGNSYQNDLLNKLINVLLNSNYPVIKLIKELEYNELKAMDAIKYIQNLHLEIQPLSYVSQLPLECDELHLKVRTYNYLKRAGINTITELANTNLLKVKDLGIQSATEAALALTLLGLKTKVE